MSDLLKLENQLCFPIYAASRLVIKLYQPILSKLDITYTQYLILLILWENNNLRVTDICNILVLETNTITPLIKRLENKGLIKKLKSLDDNRSYIISLTDRGKSLKIEACKIPIELYDNFRDSFDIKRIESLKKELNELIKILK